MAAIMSAKYRGSDQVVVCFFGDGATNLARSGGGPVFAASIEQWHLVLLRKRILDNWNGVIEGTQLLAHCPGTRSAKFSFGDESFLLDLGVQTYPAVGPGQYSAHEDGSSIGVMLFLGQADAGDQGRFVPDYKVFWLGRSGTFTINPDMKSGSLDAVLAGPLEHAGSTVHISGNWRCAA